MKLAVVACLVVAVRVRYVQVVVPGKYLNACLPTNRVTSTLRVVRGNLLDCNGAVLATTLPAFHLQLSTDAIANARANIGPLAELLRRPAAVVAARLDRFMPVTPSPAPSAQTAAVAPAGRRKHRVLVLPWDLDQQSAESALELAGAGASLITVDRRADPLGIAGQLLGRVHVRPDGSTRGVSGIEAIADRALAGEFGRLQTSRDKHGADIVGTDAVVKPVVPTRGVKLTLDSRVQEIAEVALQGAAEQFKPDGASITVMDPNTGNILAMASYPLMGGKYKLGMPATAGFLNRALIAVEPGSVLKLVTVAAYVDTHPDYANFRFNCTGRYVVGGHGIACAPHNGSTAHGEVDLEKILVDSCNGGAANVALHLGSSVFANWLKRFRMVGPSGLHVPYEVGGSAQICTSVHTGAGALARNGFGQGLMVSPVAIATAYSVPANGGFYVQPRLVQSIEQADGSWKPQVCGPPVRIITPATASTLKEMLTQVVERGTGTPVKMVDYTVAGKTGTAQQTRPKHRGYAPGVFLSSFVGFAPASKPRYVVCVMVDHPLGKHYGAEVAAPIFKQVMRQILVMNGILPDRQVTLARYGQPVIAEASDVRSGRKTATVGVVQ